ncbi:DUF2827 family protein [Paraburkholderia sp. BR14262]|uniref:DUF2827 family protein n=1 Tax=Paraburkholderia sp. BR14262 TaxID=3236999 RepID=UPI0034CF05E5
MLTHTGQSVWENGLGQNVVFLARLLRELPFVSDVVLLNCGDQTSLPSEAEGVLPGVRLVPAREATGLIDVAIEMGGGLDVEWLDYLRALSKKVVFFCCGQPYAGLIEPTIFKKGGYFSRADRCDEIWMLRKDRALTSMMQALHRCPVYEVPFLWDSVFIERRASLVAEAGYQFGYQPQADRKTQRGFNVAIFEPNISVLKCCVIPMLIADAAYRSERASVERLHVLNSVQMKDHPSFSFLTNSLELHSGDRIHLDQRHDFVGYMSQHADAVIAHQWQNDQNILHLDALYGGYPLIHNSQWLAELGYYYPDSDVRAGAGRLIEAAREHDARHSLYTQKAREFLAGLGSNTLANRSAYARRLLHVQPHHTGGLAPC